MPSSPFPKGKRKVTSPCPGSSCLQGSGPGSFHLSQQASHRTALSSRNPFYHLYLVHSAHFGFSGGRRKEKGSRSSADHSLWGAHSSGPSHGHHAPPSSHPGHASPVSSKLSGFLVEPLIEPVRALASSPVQAVGRVSSVASKPST